MKGAILQQLESGWLAAAADAGYAPGDARLYLLAGAAPRSGRSAMWFEPGSTVFRTPETPFSVGQHQDINSGTAKSLHRVTAFQSGRLPVVIAQMRHELEHAQQWDAAGKPVFEIYKHVYELGSVLFGGLPQSGRFYGLVPAEQDANTAAGQFAQTHLPPATVIAELANDHSILFRSPGATDPGSLLARMVGFAAIWRSEFEQVLTDANESPASVLTPESLAQWRALEADQVFQGLSANVAAVSPDAMSLAGLSDGATRDRWLQLAAAVEAATDWAASLTPR